MRPCTSGAAAAGGSRRTARRRWATSVRERDALDTLGEHDLAVEGAVDRALGGDDPQLLDLLGAELLGEAHDEVEARGAAAVGRRVVAGALTPPRSQPLRWAYISIVTAVQDASAAASSSSGSGPVSVPPMSARSSPDSSWLRILTVWRKPLSRVAVAFIGASS